MAIRTIQDLRIYSDEQAPRFCNCKFPTFEQVAAYKHHIPDVVKCRCGESDDLHCLQWTWREEPNIDAIIKGEDVVFHPEYSQGTVGVRGTRELSAGLVHFWEIRMITVLTGTDIMFGIGTEDFTFEEYKFSFVSALGINANSWGYSFYGYIQHNEEKRKYGQRFSQACLLGILVDRTRGIMEFYLNRRPLGVAFTNIPLDPNVKLYPIVCSTSAKSVVRLVNAIAQPDSLQLRSYRALTQLPASMKELQEMPGLRTLIRKYWFFSPELYAQFTCNGLDLTDEAILPTKRSRKQKYIEENDEDEDDIYADAHKIFVSGSDSEDENHVPNEFLMDEYFNRLH